MIIKNKKRSERANLKKKVFALSGISLMLLEIFAFSFIIGGMVVISSEGVSGAEETIAQLQTEVTKLTAERKQKYDELWAKYKSTLPPGSIGDSDEFYNYLSIADRNYLADTQTKINSLYNDIANQATQSTLGVATNPPLDPTPATSPTQLTGFAKFWDTIKEYTPGLDSRQEQIDNWNAQLAKDLGSKTSQTYQEYAVTDYSQLALKKELYADAQTELREYNQEVKTALDEGIITSEQAKTLVAKNIGDATTLQPQLNQIVLESLSQTSAPISSLYKIQSGDTLESIAKNYANEQGNTNPSKEYLNQLVTNIKAQNPTTAIAPGQTLDLNGIAPALPMDWTQYSAYPGQTVQDVALDVLKSVGINTPSAEVLKSTIEQIKENNNIKSDTLSAGQTLDLTAVVPAQSILDDPTRLYTGDSGIIPPDNPYLKKSISTTSIPSTKRLFTSYQTDLTNYDAKLQAKYPGINLNSADDLKRLTAEEKSIREGLQAGVTREVASAKACLGTSFCGTAGAGGWESSKFAMVNIAEGLAAALAVVAMFETLGKIFMSEKSFKEKGKAIEAGLAAGIFAYKTTYGLTRALGGTESAASSLGLVLGALAAYYAYSERYIKTDSQELSIEFKCMSWQAPRGGSKCDQCNIDKQKPCSEYRCKSLGQTCKLINAGTKQEKCIDGSRNDVTSPGIKPNPEVLTTGLSYTNVKPRPPGGAGSAGMTIAGTKEGGCIEAFTPFEFGIITTEVGDVVQESQCKIDYLHTDNFNAMNYYMENSNIFDSKHKQAVMLPGTDALNTYFADLNGTLDIKNAGDYKMYIRCKDGNGNENKDEFVVSFCIDKTPDTQAPIIKGTNIASGSGVKYQQDNVSIEVYTNEPSKCRWSRKDSSYINMENNMSCSNAPWETNANLLYTCKSMLTSVKDRVSNDFYFRCEDLKGTKMAESYPLTLKGSQPLTLLSVGPSGTVGGSTSTVIVNLQASTDNGLSNGVSTCYYSTDKNKIGYPFFETNSTNHKQPLDLTGGTYTYYITCVDAAGNSAANSTTFNVYVDKDSPIILRAFAFENNLVVETEEASNCRYSNINCNFDISKQEGTAMPYDETTQHKSDFDTSKNYYIKCSDKYGNMPNPSECSMTIQPYSLSVASTA